MENGGKRKRVGLSLKSFKKPALNYFKKPSFGNRLDEEPSRTGKANSATSLSSQEKSEIPISENRMKLLNLMPRFLNWNKMASLPFSPLMKPLSETKNEVTGETSENTSKAINKEQGSKTYVDLPKLGIRYFKHRIKAQLFNLNENDETCFTIAVSKPSDVEIKLTEAEHGRALDKRKPRGLKKNTHHENRECKQNRPEFSRYHHGKEDAVNEKCERLENVLRLSDEGLAKSDQNNSSVAIVDVDSDDDYSDSQFNELGSSNEMRNSLLYSSKNTSKVNSFPSTTGKVQDVVARLVYENNAISAPTQGMSKVNSSYNPSDNVQVSKSMEKHVDSGKSISKSSNFYTTTRNDQRAQSKNTVPKTSKGIPKVNSLYTMSSNETHVQARKLKETPAYRNKVISLSNSLCNTAWTNQCQQSMNKGSYASKGNTKVNGFYPKSRSEAHVQTNKLKETPAQESKDISLSSILCNNTWKDQHEKSMKNSSYANKRNTKVNNLYKASNQKRQLQSNKARPPPGYEKKCFSKTNSFYKKSVNQSGSINLDDDFSASKDTNGDLRFSEDLFGDDDELDEILANSFTDELGLVQNANLGNRVDSKGFNELQLIKEDLANDDGGVEDLIGYLDDDMDADALVACCDDAMSPTIPVREKSSLRPSSSLNNSITSKGVKRRLDIPDGQSKIRRSDNCNNLCEPGSSSDLDKSFKDHDRLKECPLCAKRFHSGFSIRDIAQHIAMCCGSDESGTDDAFW